MHHLNRKCFRNKANGLPTSAQLTKVCMWITVLGASTGCTEGSAPSQAAQRHQNATLARSRSRRAAMLESQPFSQMEWQCWEKWNKPQLSHQHTQKIGLLVVDPSATSWWRSQEDLTLSCLHNRGHKGENIASSITSIYNFSDNLFIIITLSLVITNTLSCHSWQLSSLEAAIYLLIYTIIYLVAD